MAPSQPDVTLLPVLLQQLSSSATNLALDLLLRLGTNGLPHALVRPLLCPITKDSEGVAGSVVQGTDRHLALNLLTEEEDPDVKAGREDADASYVKVVPRTGSREL